MTKESTAPESRPDDEHLVNPAPRLHTLKKLRSARFSDNVFTRWLIPAALLILGAVMLLLILVALGILLSLIPFQ
jgi:hypothetical protein